MDDEDRPDKSPPGPRSPAAEVPTPAPEGSDRSKRLLSQDALPVIEVPRSAPHQIREFRLPAGLSGPVVRPAAARDDEPAQGKSAPAEDKSEPAEGKAEPAEAKTEPAKAKTEPAKAKAEPDKAKAEPDPGKSKGKAEPAKAKAEPDKGKAKDKTEPDKGKARDRTEPGGKKKRADSTARFGDRTLEWLREGDELEDQPAESSPDEPEDAPRQDDAGDRASHGALWIGLVIAIAAAAALALWQLT